MGPGGRPPRARGGARPPWGAEPFPYLNALRPGVFSIEDIGRGVAAQKGGSPPGFDARPPIDPPIKP